MRRLWMLVAMVPATTACGSSTGNRTRSPASVSMVSPVPLGAVRAAAEETLRPELRDAEIQLATVPPRGAALHNGSALLGAFPGLAQSTPGGGGPAPSSAAAVAPVAPVAPVAAAGQPSGQAAAPSRGVREMLAVEAHVTIDVAAVGAAIMSARELILKHDGQLINDVYSDGRNHASAALSIRIPAASTDAFLAEVSALGRLRERRVTAADVGKQVHDQVILLRNLHTTMARHEELIGTAKVTKDLLDIENELTRLRTQMDNLRSQLGGLGDRVERSTIYLSLQPVRQELPEIYEPEAHFYPDFHGTYLHDLGDKSSFVGGGVGVRASRHFGADISALKHLDGPFKRDLLIATMGGELYSDFLGGGRRTVGNVFLGARAGVLYARGRTEAIVPLTLGLELLHTKTLTIEARGRADIFFGSTRGAHLGLQPDLGVAFAF